MVSQPKGKQGTKGSKQIVEENAATLKFYRNMSVVSSLIFIIVMLLFTNAFTGVTITMTILSLAAHIGCYQFMSMMCRTNISESGQILDSGTDLNMEGGIAEHVKDLIILTSGTQLLSLFSTYFWLLLLLAPIRAFYLLWGSVIKPWLSQKSEQQTEVDEKKQKKLDRRMKRMKN